MQSAVMGVTTAIGVWELGSATRGHGTGGAVAAGLGGAVSGMIAGLSMSGGDPLGAAVGDVIGGLIGLASHFDTTTKSVNASNTAMQTWMTTTYKADNYKIGSQFTSGINTDLTSNPGFASALAGAGVKMPQIVAFLRGTNDNIDQTIDQALTAGKITQGEAAVARAGLGSLAKNFGVTATDLSNVAAISGKTTQYIQEAAAQSQATLEGVLHSRTPVPQGYKPSPVHHVGSGDLGTLLGTGLTHRALGGPLGIGQVAVVGENGPEIITPRFPMTVHSHQASMSMGAGGWSRPQVIQVVLDRKVIAEAVARGTLDEMARQ